MASIIKYFTKKPNSVGVSTFQVADQEDFNIDGVGLNPNYQTLIGSCKDNWDAKDNHALLVHAADLFWGDAEFVDSKANEILQGIGVHEESNGKRYIRTSSDIIAVLEYLLAHMNDGPVLIPSLKLEPNTTINFTSESAKQTIKALLNNTNDSVNDVTWKVEVKSKSNCKSDFSISAAKGESIQLTGPTKDTTQANPATKGTIKSLGSWSTNSTTSGGTASITAAMNNDYKAGVAKTAAQEATITASISSLSASVTANYTASIPGSTITSSWSWSPVTGQSLPDGIKATISGATLTFTNSKEVTVKVNAGVYQVTNAQASNIIYNTEITVPAKTATPVTTKYYWYINTQKPTDETVLSSIESNNKTPGWHYIGTSLPQKGDYTLSNPLSASGIPLTKGKNYVAVPKDSIIYLGDASTGNNQFGDDYVYDSEITIENVKYSVYASTSSLIKQLDYVLITNP